MPFYSQNACHNECCFLAINHKRKPGFLIWYFNSPLSKNAIGKFLVNAAKATGLPGNLSNHSLRKTWISHLMDANLPENYVAQLSGHKNLVSLDTYKSASQRHQRRMWMVLNWVHHYWLLRQLRDSSTQNNRIAISRARSIKFEEQRLFLRSNNWQFLCLKCQMHTYTPDLNWMSLIKLRHKLCF